MGTETSNPNSLCFTLTIIKPEGGNQHETFLRNVDSHR